MHWMRQQWQHKEKLEKCGKLYINLIITARLKKLSRAGERRSVGSRKYYYVSGVSMLQMPRHH